MNFTITSPLPTLCQLYSTSITNKYGSSAANSYGQFYIPKANVTFGVNMAGKDVVFRRMYLAAECGRRTSYTVGFNYTASTPETQGCVEVDGICIFPAYMGLREI